MKESLVGKKLSIASAAVPWALSLLGVPVPAVTGGLSTAAALVGAFPTRRKNLAVFVGRAMEDFDSQCTSEARGLGEADIEAIQHRLEELLSASSNRDGLLGRTFWEGSKKTRSPTTPPAMPFRARPRQVGRTGRRREACRSDGFGEGTRHALQRTVVPRRQRLEQRLLPLRREHTRRLWGGARRRHVWRGTGFTGAGRAPTVELVTWEMPAPGTRTVWVTRP